MRKKLLSILTLLLVATTGAMADSFSTTPYSSDASLSNVTVTENTEITINEGVTVTVNGGINVSSGIMLTVNGPGTLVVNGTAGSKGADKKPQAGNGGTGGTAISGAVTIYGGTLNAHGGTGGNGGSGSVGLAGGGGGGNAFSDSSTLTYYGGTVNATGGSGGSGSGSTTTGKAFASNSVTLGSTPTTLTGDGSNINITTNPTVTNKTTVIILGPTYVPVYYVTGNLVDDAYWATFYAETGNYEAPSNTDVFAVQLKGTTIKMIPVEDRIVKSGEGVVLKQARGSNDPTTTIIMTKTETAATESYFTDNSLEGTMTVINTTGSNDYYVLNGVNGAGFYKLSNESGTIPANKAYLTYSSGSGPAHARAYFLFNETTGIEMPTVTANDNADAVVNDLQGRHVVNPTKGLYIVNGKKVVIK